MQLDLMTPLCSSSTFSPESTKKYLLRRKKRFDTKKYLLRRKKKRFDVLHRNNKGRRRGREVSELIFSSHIFQLWKNLVS